jgi:hypothetical protein
MGTAPARSSVAIRHRAQLGARRRTRFVASLIAVLASACADNNATVAPTPKFYHGKNYGTEAQFNPLTEILNEGFDQLRNDNTDRRLSRLPWGGHNVVEALLHPDSAMRAYGVWRAWRDELLPLSVKGGGGGQWVPNYEFHLIGSGMVSQRMVEWYQAHDVPHPLAASVVTMMSAHFINEALEDGGRPVRYHPFDPVADIYVFDIGGILLFRSGKVQNFFSNTVELTNWPGQPTFAFPGTTLENAGQEFLLRARVPRTDNFRAFFAFGISTLGGISIGPKGGTALSFALGADAVDNPIIDYTSGRKTVILKPNAGMFIDRDGSLLFSLTARHSAETIASANLYPGAMRVGGQSFGLWTQALKNGRWRLGLVGSRGIGIGTSAR